ncbi:hypothetical protein CRUP_038053 [Coryphaenoides rupestris]|nr:hypothetical protein CRUP_038053 [Coryphaenoides rupestris]
MQSVYRLAWVAGGVEEDCSFATLFRHLNLTTPSDRLVHIQPVKHWKTAMTVWVDMVVYGIIELWKDEFLRWHPERFCGIKQLEVPRELLWSPDTMIQEDSSIPARHVTLYQDGRVLAVAVRQLKAVCQMNLYHFPVDKQHCKITFGLFSISGDKVMPLTNSMEVTSMSEHYMSTNGEWELTGITINPHDFQTETYNHSRLIYGRRPLLYIVNCILPLFCFLVLDVGTFFISWAQGEKLSLKVTLLLSISSVYTIVIFCLMAVSLLEAMKLGSYGRLALKIDTCFFAVYMVCNVVFLSYIFYVWELF